MIRFEFEGELVALPRAGQLTYECILESWEGCEREGRAFGSRPERQVTGRFAGPPRGGGEEFTRLRFRVDGVRVEVTAVGAALERAVQLEVGQRVRVRGELQGEEPYYHPRVKRADALRVL